MTDAIAIIAFLTVLVLVITGIHHLFRKTGQAKKIDVFTIAAFLVFAVSISIAGCTSSAPQTDKAVSAQNTNVAQANTPNNNTKEQVKDQEQLEPSTLASSASNNDATKAVSGTLKVHYIDVGQADSILVQLPSGQNMLIDAGNNADSNLVVNYLKSQGVKRLDYVIGTHPHEDHIGGMDVAIKSFDIGKVYLPKVTSNTKTYEDLLTAIQSKGLKITQAKAGVTLDVGSGATAELLAPNGSSYDDLNNYSAVLKLTFGKTSFLFEGDAEALSESEMLKAGYNLRADVLKVGHHGSSSSTSPAFLKAVAPKYAVISVGKDNDYGHPHPETLAKLSAAVVQVFRTDLQGTIVATSDGKTITFNKSASPVKERAPSNVVSSTSGSTSNNTSANVVPATAAPAGNGSVVIASIDLKSDLVTIKNNSSSAVNLAGWRLVSEKGNQNFNFPSGTTISAGGTVKVVSGKGAVAGPGTLLWTTTYIWNNDGDPGSLYDASGKLVSRYPR